MERTGTYKTADRPKSYFAGHGNNELRRVQTEPTRHFANQITDLRFVRSGLVK